MSQPKHFLEKLPIWKSLPVHFFSDATADSVFPVSHPVFTLIKNRNQFREFCISQKIPAPGSFCSDRFDKISAWAISRNKFPMVLKTAKNLSDGQLVFLLKAFRELPEFHELIAESSEGPVIIEDFIQAKAYVEVTTIEGRIIFTSQFSLERSMRMRHNWRAFPINLPASLSSQISDIIAKFPDLISLKNIPVRFSFALTKPSATLLSLNSGFNRPEYSPEWLKSAGLPDIYSGSQIKSEKLFKVLCLHSLLPAENSEEELRRHCDDIIINYLADESQTIIMLGHKNASKLQEAGKWISGFFMQASNEPLNNNETED